MNGETSAPLRLRNILLGTAAGALACMAVLLLTAAAVVAMGRIPQQLLVPLSIFSAAVGAFVAGLVGSVLAGRGGLLYGFSCSFLLFLLILVGGVIESTEWTGAMLIKLGVMLLCGMLGGVIGVNRRLRY